MHEAFGLSVWYGSVQGMPRGHHHYEIELNFIEQGSMLYLFGAGQYRFPAGQLALFWAAVPHQLIDFEPDTRCYWVTIPLAHFLQWAIPDPFTAQIMGGSPLHSEHEAQAEADLLAFQRWNSDWAKDHSEYRKIVLLEIEARLRRF